MIGQTNHGGYVEPGLGMIRNILQKECSEMPKRYQNPKLERRDDVAVPFWFIRVRVSDPAKKKTRTVLKLGFCHEMNRKDAMKKRAEGWL